MKRYFPFLLALISVAFSFDEDVIVQLKEKANTYFARYKRSKLELVFNQPRYIPGDTVRFRIIYVDAADLKPIAGKQLVHICLFDQSGVKTQAKWASVSNGFSNGEWVIPKDFPSGNYVLVAFTEWMKNGDQSLFFRKQFMVSGTYAIKSLAPKDTLEFFPEGGSLIANVENKMAIRYTGSENRIKMTIREQEKEVASIDLTMDSVDVLRFTPRANARYFAEINVGGNIKRISLPETKQTGVSLQVDIVETRFKINVQATEVNQQNYFLALFNNKGMVFNSRFDFDAERKASLDLPSGMPKGVTQLVLFDSKLNLLASRVIYIDRPDKKEIEIGKLPDVCATRQEFSLDLKIKDKDGYAVPGFFSCRIINDDLFATTNTLMMDYLTFQSDISNTVELSANASSQAINNYLITQTCPWFNWKKLIDNDKSPLQYKTQQYLGLTGKAVFAKNRKHVADSTHLSFFLEKSLLGYETYTNSKGEFSFPLVLSTNHADKLFYSASLRGNDIDEVSVTVFDLDSSYRFFAKPWVTDKGVVDRYATFSAQRQAINNSYSFFTNVALMADSINEPNKAIEDELNGPDVVVTLSDFLQMPTMEEVLREIVRAVEYRKINGRNVVRVYTTAKKPTNYTGPLYVIDGALTKDPSFILALKPSEVVSLKVVKDSKKLFPLGVLGVNGVILIKTKLRNAQIRDKHVFDFAGLLPEPKSISYGNVLPQTPDLRPCLFWRSGIFKNNESGVISFKTSDDVGKFKVQISGLADDGTSFYAERPFQVKYPGN